jgi:hypothetical protein
MWAGVRKHELIYNIPNKHASLLEESHVESDVFTDGEDELDH